MIDYREIIGLMAMILTSFALIPQILKTYKTKSCKDISFITLIQYTLGVSLWLLYGTMINNNILILANTIGLTSFLILIMMKLCYKKLNK